MKSKNKKYINNIRVICEADIRSGRLLTLKNRLKECIKSEDYETAELTELTETSPASGFKVIG